MRLRKHALPTACCLTHSTTTSLQIYVRPTLEAVELKTMDTSKVRGTAVGWRPHTCT